MNTARSKRNAFTLIELLVVVSIIALLIGISVPAFKKVRNQAKAVDSRALITNLESGLSTFQAERALGGRLPPSASDADGVNIAPGTFVDYYDASGTEIVSTGASLLVLAMAGPDKQGTAGFRPEGAANTWAESVGGQGSGGLYDLTRATPATRYGPYVGDSGMKKLKTIADVQASGFLIPKPSDHFGEQLVFTDLLKSPILYYQARKASRQMISVGPTVGIYNHNDNAALTSWPDAGSLVNRHRIAAPGAVGLPMVVPDTPNSNTFASFILDRDASACSDVDPGTGNVTCPRAIPHRAKDFLLISAGIDGLWGTPDDITNWK